MQFLQEANSLDMKYLDYYQGHKPYIVTQVIKWHDMHSFSLQLTCTKLSILFLIKGYTAEANGSIRSACPPSAQGIIKTSKGVAACSTVNKRTTANVVS